MISPYPAALFRSVLKSGVTGLTGLLIAGLLIAVQSGAVPAARPAASPAVPAPARASASPAPNTLSISAYQDRLQYLDRLLANCQRYPAPANCKSDAVGPDNLIQLPSGPRQIRYEWLRELLDRAGKDKSEAEKAAKSPAANAGVNQNPASEERKPEFTPPSISQQLDGARKRLDADAQAVQQLATTGPGSSPATPKPDSAISSQRQALTRILAAREYHAAAAGPSLTELLLEKLGNFLDRVIASLQRAGFQSRWVGLTAEFLFIVAISVLLVWFLIRLERQGRLAASSIRSGPGADAASARDWQLWAQDARAAAARGAWRDAIHLTYWASISRLESSGLWPADRARTPREYLALLSPESTARPGLASLTRSFERTWYAGRPAAEADFREAERIASQMGERQRDFGGPR